MPVVVFGEGRLPHIHITPRFGYHVAMSGPHERHRNAVKAGIFMTVAIALVLIVIAVLKDAWTTITSPRARYAITFPVKSGVQALNAGSSVRVGGLEMGRVVEVRLAGIQPDRDPTSAVDPFESIVVVIELDRRVPLYSNATAFVKGALIGSDAWIEIISIGYESRQVDGEVIAGGALMSPDDLSRPLPGYDAGTMLAAILGPEGAEKAGRILDDVGEFTPLLARFPRDYDDYLQPTLVNVNLASADLRDLVSRITHEDWPAWTLSVNHILDNVLSASQNLDLAMEDGRRMIGSADLAVGDVREVIEHNRPNVDEMLANLNLASADARRLMERLARDTIEKVEMLIDRGQDGLDSFARLGSNLEREFDYLSPQLRDAMASLSNASNELALGTAEIRHSPWRLLYRPSTDELEYENLYFAASRYAFASSELKMAAQSMERVMENHRDALSRQPERFEQMQQALAETYQRYEAAQRDLMDLLAATRRAR